MQAMFVSAKIGHSYLLLCTFLSASLIALISIFLLGYSWNAITSSQVELLGTVWNPARNQFGILPMLYGSVAVTIIALLLALPLGLITAIFTSEILPGRFRLQVKSLLELLAGIPSIIYGLIGVVFLSTWLESLFDLQTGRTILTAGLLLALMILPTIITLCDDAIHNIPSSYRDAASSLGLYQYEVIMTVLLPIARTDIIGASLLALGRALGETMAVMLVIGSIDRLPQSLISVLEPGQTITSKLGREIAETSFGSLHFSAMIFMALVLLIFVLALTMLALQSYPLEKRLYE